MINNRHETYTYCCIYALSLLTLFSCNDGSKQQSTTVVEKESTHIIDLSELDFSDEPQRLSEFADSLSYIRLSDEPLLPDLLTIEQIAMDDSGYIYVDQRNINKYTAEGKFVKQLFKHGQGPGEVAQKLRETAFDWDKRVAKIQDYGYSNGRKVFSLDGVWLYNEDVMDSMEYIRHPVAYIDGKEIFYHKNRSHYYKRGDPFNVDGPILWYVKDTRNGEIVFQKKNPFYHITVEKGRAMAMLSNYPVSRGEIDSVFWMRHIHQDTLFRTCNAIYWQPWYVLHTGDKESEYKTKIELMTNPMSSSKARTIKMISQLYPLPTGVLYKYCSLGIEKTGTGFCKADSKALTVSEKPFVNDLDNHLKNVEIPFNMLYQRAGYLYFLVDAWRFLEEGCTPPFPNLTEDSNPIIVKMKLKS